MGFDQRYGRALVVRGEDYYVGGSADDADVVADPSPRESSCKILRLGALLEPLLLLAVADDQEVQSVVGHKPFRDPKESVNALHLHHPSDQRHHDRVAADLQFVAKPLTGFGSLTGVEHELAEVESKVDDLDLFAWGYPIPDKVVAYLLRDGDETSGELGQAPLDQNSEAGLPRRREHTVEDVAVEGVNADRGAGFAAEHGGNAAHESRLRGVGVKQVRSVAPDYSHEREERPKIVKADFPLERGDVLRMDRVLDGKVMHVALIGPLGPVHDRGFVSASSQPVGQHDHLDGGAPHVEPRDHADHPDRLARGALHRPGSAKPHGHYDTSEACRMPGGRPLGRRAAFDLNLGMRPIADHDFLSGVNPAAHRVLATSAMGPRGPSFRVRVLLLRRALERAGVTVESQPLFSVEEATRFRRASLLEKTSILRRAALRQRESLTRSQAGTVLISRQAGLEPVGRAERVAMAGRRLVYDVDDAIWHSGRHEAGGHPLAFLKGSRRKAKWLARRAETVIAGNAILAEWLSGYSGRVVVIPSTVSTDYPLRRHEQRNELVVGWIGSHSTVRNLRRIAPALGEMGSAIKPRSLRLLVVGAPAFAIPHAVVEAVPWSEPAEREALGRIDVGLMPLSDDPWTRGKCAYKALQYMSAGIPVVADDVGIARSVIEGSRAGTVLGSTGSWKHAVGELLVDPRARTRLGACGHEAVKREFSPERWVPALASILRGDA